MKLTLQIIYDDGAKEENVIEMTENFRGFFPHMQYATILSLVDEAKEYAVEYDGVWCLTCETERSQCRIRGGFRTGIEMAVSDANDFSNYMNVGRHLDEYLDHWITEAMY